MPPAPRAIVVGTGFGGRSLCLAVAAPPPLPYEIAVWVKLDDEAGASPMRSPTHTCISTVCSQP